MFEVIVRYGRLIKFSHSVFALPFALASIVLIYKDFPQLVAIPKILWIIVAMISARSAAMGFNRYADRKIDAINPRTKEREIPKGVISPAQTLIFIFISIAVFVFSANRLNELAFFLSPVALIVILGYSYTKRFTHFSHLILGLGLALAPLGAWISITGKFDLVPVLLAFGVLFWVAGFDVIYACQDFEFDQNENMHSIPVMLGLRKALISAKFFHIFAAIFFICMGIYSGLNWLYFTGLFLIVIVMFLEHRLVNEHDLSKINMAFFNLNGIISVSFFIVVLISVWMN